MSAHGVVARVCLGLSVLCVALPGVASRALGSPGLDSSLMEPYRERIEAAIDRGVVRLAAMQTGDGAFGETGGGSYTPIVGLAGMALICLLMCGYPTDTPMLQRAAEVVANGVDANGRIYWTGATIPGRNSFMLYYCVTSAFYYGGTAWDQLGPRVSDLILKRQAPNGSWGGPYDTALMLMSLGVVRHQIPIYQR